MNRRAYQQRALVGGFVGVGDGVVCPKPRRIGLFNSPSFEPIRPTPFLQINNQQSEACDSKAGTELLDIILTKGESYDMEDAPPSFEMGSSPPFFFGSPPSRVPNPLIQDSQFGNHNFVPILAIPEQVAAPTSPPPPSSFTPVPAYGGGCVPMKFGNKPAAVRIEGFNCSSSISAVA